MKFRFMIPICLALLIISVVLYAERVELLRVIDFKKAAKRLDISSLILGESRKMTLNPSSICQIRRNRYAVTDTVHGAVSIIDRRGNILKKISKAGKLKLISPVSSCSDDRDNLYVADSARGAVFRFDDKYKFQENFLTPSESRITGVVYSQEMFFCADVLGHRILCFNRKGTLIKSFGKRGTGNGDFNFPTHITADDAYIYVTDAMNFRVQIFGLNGDFVRTFGTPGRGGGNFSKPKGIAVDKKRRIFVADAEFDNVQIFNFKGEFLYHIGGPGHTDEEFWMPSGVVIDRYNLLWVADTYNSRIQIFKVME